MDGTVDVTIPVEPEAAAALADARNREAVGRLVSRVPATALGFEPARSRDRRPKSRGESSGSQRC